jgi:hypothetical protein
MRRMARAIGDRDVGEVEQFGPAVPRRQPLEGVRAENQHQGSLWAEFGAQAFEGEHGIAFLRRAHFAVVDFQSRISGDREAGHRQPVGGRGTRCAAMRRLPGRDQTHPLQVQGFARFLGQPQMAKVNRVEGAAQHTQCAQRARVGLQVLSRHRGCCRRQGLRPVGRRPLSR